MLSQSVRQEQAHHVILQPFRQGKGLLPGAVTSQLDTPQAPCTFQADVKSRS